jgi:hypothetical protein
MANRRGLPLHERYDIGPECWEWNGARGVDGYGRVQRAHRVMWTEANGPIPKGMIVCHKCDNPPCVRPDHLFLGTPRDNALDRDRKGRRDFSHLLRAPRPVGEQTRHVLTEAQVLKMRRIYSRGATSQAALARRFVVSKSLVQAIVSRKIWRHV